MPDEVKTVNNKPKFESVPLNVGLSWTGGDGYFFEEKIDGVWHEVTCNGAELVGELFSGVFYAFDILSLHGSNLRLEPLYRRLSVLDEVTCQHNLKRPKTGNGGEFLEAILRDGGEGIVAKQLDAPYGVAWLKCKRVQVFYVTVTGLRGYTGAVELCDTVTLEPRGYMPLRTKFEQVRVGSKLKVEAYGLTAKGLLREARPDKDAPGSWLVEY